MSEETKIDPDHPKNEIKIKALSPVGRTLDYINQLLTKDNYPHAILRGVGKAIPKVV